MRSLLLATGIALTAAAIHSCNDDNTIGKSIMDDNIAIVIDSNFSVTSRTIANDALLSRMGDTLYQILGGVDLPGYGTLSGEFVAQFMPAATINIVSPYEERNTVVDSITLQMTIDRPKFIGDSLVPMGIKVYRLNRNLPSPIYSNFDPSGYYSEADLIGSRVYSIDGVPDSIAIRGTRTIDVSLPTDLAHELYGAYVDNPANFADPEAFVDNVFKGIYVKNSFGSGRLTYINSTKMILHYHDEWYDTEHSRDTIVQHTGTFFSVAPEVISNTEIKYGIDPALAALAASGEPITIAPLGYNVEITLPTQRIIDRYKQYKSDYSVLNTLTMSIPADTIYNPSGVGVPPYMLLVRADSYDDFFLKSELPDNIKSFYAIYNSKTKSYDFGAMRQYLIEMMNKEGGITPDDTRFILCPVQIFFQRRGNSMYTYDQVESAMTPYISGPVMAKFDIPGIKIKLTFTSQTINF